MNCLWKEGLPAPPVGAEPLPPAASLLLPPIPCAALGLCKTVVKGSIGGGQAQGGGPSPLGRPEAKASCKWKVHQLAPTLCPPRYFAGPRLGCLRGGEKANPPLVPLDCSWFLSAQPMLLFSALEQALITALDACPLSPTLMTEQGKVWDGEDSG